MAKEVRVRRADKPVKVPQGAIPKLLNKGGFLSGPPKRASIVKLKPGEVSTPKPQSKISIQVTERLIRLEYFGMCCDVDDLAKRLGMTVEDVTKVIAATPESTLKKFAQPARKPPKLTRNARNSIIGEHRLLHKTPEQISESSGFDVATILDILADHERLKQLARSR